MIKKIVILIVSLIFMNGCSGAVFEKGLNYKETLNYQYDDNDNSTTIINKKSGKYVNIGFGTVACGYYGLIGPLIFPIIPIWENRNCKEVVIDIWEYRVGIKNAQILYQNKAYNPSKISDSNYYTFPLPIKSITDTATLVIEDTSGEIFKISFKYQHTFSFALFPGR